MITMQPVKGRTPLADRSGSTPTPTFALQLKAPGYPDHDAAKSGGWAYAQAHGAVFVPTRRGRP